MKPEGDLRPTAQPRRQQPVAARTGLSPQSTRHHPTSRISPFVIVAILFAALLFAYCGKEEVTTTIGDIRAAPSNYADKRVVVRGEVTNAFGIFSFGLYDFKDQTGEIKVLTMGGLPAVGSRFTLYGSVMTGLTISGRNYGTAIRESERTGDRASSLRKPLTLAPGGRP